MPASSKLRALVGRDGPPLRTVLGTTGWYPLAVLTTLNVVDELDHAVIAVFAPNIRRHFGLTNAELGAIVGVHLVLVIVVGVPVGYWATKVDRTRVLRWSAALWSVFSTATVLAVRLPVFLVTRLGTGFGKASVDPVGKALLTDFYPPNAWNRVLSVHNAANPFGAIVGPLLAGVIGLLLDGDDAWRWAYPVLTVPTIFALLAARRLREPEFHMMKDMGAQMLSATMAPHGLSFRQAAGQIVRIRTFRAQMVGIGVLGFALVGAVTFASVLLEEEFGVGEGGRGVVTGILATASLAGTLLGGRVGERVFAASPSGSIKLVGGSVVAFSAILPVAVAMPNVVLFVVVLWLGILAVSIAMSPLGAALSAVTPAQLRPLMFSLLGVFIAVFGGFLGGVFVGAVADVHGIRVGLASLAPFGMVGGLLMARGAATIDADLAAAEADAGLATSVATV
ncbi:MAG TPA: MFS transporter [Acidimicrobiales bacterium]|nr:MFS transporter [Acidimicrobiales bacterium]